MASPLTSPLPPEQQTPASFTLPAHSEDPPWTLKDVLRLALIALLTIVALSGLALVGLARLTGSDDPGNELAKDPWLLVPVMAASYVVLLVFMVLLVTRHYRRSFAAAVRWNFPALPRATGFLAAGVVLAVLVQAGSSLLPMPRQLPIDRFFRDASSAWLMAAFGTLLAPPVEELFFRGFLYPALARRAGMAASVVVTSAAFALIHASQLASAWAPLLVLFVVGVALTLTRALTRSLAASTLVHVSYNATLFVMVYWATDGFTHLEKITQ